MNTSVDSRWQGYSHQELFQLLHFGPGGKAATAPAEVWTGIAAALNEIQQDITTGVAKSGATWIGAAANKARTALAPLGEWAQQTADSANTMAISTTQQGIFLDQARADMPAPLASTIEQPNGFLGFITQQIDQEVQEVKIDAAQQRAYQVMAAYQTSTTENLKTLPSFSNPPQIVVDDAMGPKHSHRRPA